MNAVYYQAFLQSVEKWPKALCRSLLELTPLACPGAVLRTWSVSISECDVEVAIDLQFLFMVGPDS